MLPHKNGNNMNPLNRTVKKVISYNISPNEVNSFLHSNGIKAFQLVKRVTGKLKNDHTDYSIEYQQTKEKDLLYISGRKGFIQVELEPLFQFI